MESLIKLERKIDFGFLGEEQEDEELKKKLSESYIRINEPAIEDIAILQEEPMRITSMLKDSLIDGQVWTGAKFEKVTKDNIGRLPVSALRGLISFLAKEAQSQKNI